MRVKKTSLELLARLSANAMLSVLVCTLTVSCGGTSGPTDLPLSHVPAVELGSVQPGTFVFRTQADWESFWAAHPQGWYPLRQVPAVDFGSSAVAGVFASPSRCERLEIFSGAILQTTVTLRYHILTFGVGTPSSCIGNDPFYANLADLVLVPKESTEVKFEAE